MSEANRFSMKEEKMDKLRAENLESLEKILNTCGWAWVVRMLAVAAVDMESRQTDRVNAEAWATVHARLADAHVVCALLEHAKAAAATAANRTETSERGVWKPWGPILEENRKCRACSGTGKNENTFDCTACAGTGHTDVCRACLGRGSISYNGVDGYVTSVKECAKCGGKGFAS